MYDTLTNTSRYNVSEGAQVLLVYANDITGGLMTPLILFAFFIIIMMGSYFATKRQIGTGNLPASFTVAGFTTFGLSILMSLIPNLINPLVYVICLAISVIGLIWLMFSRD